MYLLFVLVFCIFMLNLVSTNCYVMHNNIRKDIQLRQIHHRSGNNNQPVISIRNTYQLINPVASPYHYCKQPVYWTLQHPVPTATTTRKIIS